MNHPITEAREPKTPKIASDAEQKRECWCDKRTVLLGGWSSPRKIEKLPISGEHCQQQKLRQKHSQLPKLHLERCRAG